MRSSALALAAALAALLHPASAQTLPGRNVLTVDCAGGVHILTGTAMEMNFDLELVQYGMDIFAEAMLEKARCACPGAPDSELRRRFLPSLEGFFSDALVDIGSGVYAPGPWAAENSCPGFSSSPLEPTFGFLRWAVGEGASGPVLPSTCSPHTIRDGQACQMSLTGGPENAWLKGPGFVHVFADNCGPETLWPFVHITCEGSGCNDGYLFVQECATDADCSTSADPDMGDAQTCRPFFGGATELEVNEGLCNLARDVGFTNGNSVNCVGLGVPSADSFVELIFNLIGRAEPAATARDLLVCTSTLDDWAKRLRGFFSALRRTLELGDDNDSDEEEEEDSLVETLFEFIPTPPFFGTTVISELDFNTVGMLPEYGELAVLAGQFDRVTCAALGCHISDLGNGRCNPACNVAACAFDGNECNTCACVQGGSDIGACPVSSDSDSFYGTRNNFGMSFFFAPPPVIVPGLHPVGDPRGDSVCSLDPNNPEQVDGNSAVRWPNDPLLPDIVEPTCFTVPLTAGTPEWFCTYGAAVDAALLPLETVLLRANDYLAEYACNNSESDFPRVRKCFCALPADDILCKLNEFGLMPGIYTVAGLVDGLATCAEPVSPVQETCPDMITRATVSSVATPLSVPPASIDRSASSLARAEVLPKENTLAYLTCDGELAVSLWNPFAKAGVSWPGARDFMNTLVQALDALDTFTASTPQPNPTLVAARAFFWQPSFWADVLAETTSDANEPSWRSEARFDSGPFFSFPNASTLSQSNFATGWGEPVAPVRVRYAGFEDLFASSPLVFTASADACSAIGFSRVAVGLDSPLIRAIFENAQTCTDAVEGDCGPGMDCVDVFDFIYGSGDDEEQEGSGPTPPDKTGPGRARYEFFDSLLYGDSRTGPLTCGAAEDGERGVLQFFRTLVLGLLGGKGPANPEVRSPGVPPEELLLVCLPSAVEEVFGARNAEVQCVSPTVLLRNGGVCDSGTGALCEAEFEGLVGPTCPNGAPDVDFLSLTSDVGEITDFTACPGGPLSQVRLERQCDETVCVRVSPNDVQLAEIMGRYTDAFELVPPSGVGGQFSFTRCTARCTFEELGDQGGELRGDPTAVYVCVEAAACENTSPTHTCHESFDLRVNTFGEIFTTVYIGDPTNNCNGVFLYGGINKCCAVAGCPGGTSPEIFVDCGGTVCSDSSLVGQGTLSGFDTLDTETLAQPGVCEKPRFTFCNSQNQVELDLNMGASFETFVPISIGEPNTVEACDLRPFGSGGCGGVAAAVCECKYVGGQAPCSTAAANVTCTELEPPSEGVLFREREFPRVDPVTRVDYRLALNIVPELGPGPGTIFTLPAPRIVSAAFTQTGAAFRIMFDANTTRGLAAGAINGACNGVVEVLGFENEGLLCTWTSLAELRVQPGAGSLIPQDATVRLLPGNNIRAAPVLPGDLSREAAGTAQLSFPGIVPTPAIDVLGGGALSLCQDEFEFVGFVVGGGAGRSLRSWTVSIIEEGTVVPIPGTESLVGPLVRVPSALFSQGIQYQVQMTAFNWLGAPGTSSVLPFTVTTDVLPQVAVNGPATRTVRLGLDSPLLSATTVFTCAGIGGPGQFVYTWEYSSSLSPTTFLPLQGAQLQSDLLLPSSFAPLPGTYNVRVTATLVSDPLVTSSATITVVATAPPPVLITRAGLQRSVLANQAMAIDFSLSCSPGAVPGCSPLYGLEDAGLMLPMRFGLPDPVSVVWGCSYRTSAAATPTTCTGSAAQNPPELLLVLPENSLATGLYSFTVTVGVFTSPVVSVTVLPAPVGCSVVQQVTMNPVDPKITVSNAGISLRGEVSGYTPGGTGAVRLLWQRVVAGVAVADTSFSAVRNRRSLQLSPASLVPGESYTFRLTASQPCTAPDHPFGEVTFTVNQAPSSGVVTSSALVGVAYETQFTLVADGFSDPDGDDPLEYAFQYTFRAPSGVVAGNEVFSLSGFSGSRTLRTSLELPGAAQAPGSNASVWVTAVARDALGAVSARTGFVRIRLTNPVSSPLWTPPSVSEALRNVSGVGGQSADVLRAVLGLASLANSAGATGSAALQQWAADTRRTTLQVLRNASQVVQARVDPTQLTLEVSVLQTVLSNPEAVDAALQAEALDFVNGLVARANATVAALRRDAADPTAVAILPAALNTDLLESLNSLMAAARASAAGARRLSSARRRMQATDAACRTSDGARDAVRALAQLLAGTVDEGAGTIDSQSSGIQLSVARENPNALGAGGDGLASLSLPPRSASRGKGEEAATSGAPSFRAEPSRGGFALPANVLGDIDFGASGGTPATVDVVAASFAFNIRCEQARAPVVALEDGVDDDCDDVNFTYAGPVTEIADVVTLEFSDSTRPGVGYDPQGLSETIRITVPRNARLVGGALCNVSNATETTCGFFDEALGDWSAAGCQLAADQSDANGDAALVVCECNHASDYSVWQAFTSDVRSTFTDPITAVTSIAILMLGVIFPTVLAIWLVGLWWAQRKDKLDADKIQKGAIGVMFMQRMQMRAKQKQFFANLKEMVAEGKQVDQLESYQALQAGGKRASKLNPFGRGLCWNFLLAIRYEHSLLGLVRFDPHYSRAQRVSVFIAIVMGNLLAASIFFELKVAKDVSPGFLISTVLLTSLFVSVPVRLLIKTLFRTSANRAGSRYDRVSNLFRVTSKLNDITPDSAGGETDFDLLLAYRRLFSAKRDVVVLRARIAMHKRAAAGAPGARPKSMAARKSDKQSAAVDPKHMSVFAFGSDGRPLDVEQAVAPPGANGSSRAVALSSSSGEEDSRDDSLPALEAELSAALGAVNGAKKVLLDKTRLAQVSWRAAPTAEAIQRMNRVRQQKSVLMRLSAMLADEALPVGKARRSCFSSSGTYAAWAMLFAFYALSVFYTSRFVLTRADRVGAGEEENEILLLWLFTAALGVLLGYVVAEPAVFFFRFALLPYFVIRCGSNRPAELSDQDVIEFEIEEGLRKNKGFDAEKYRYEANKALKAGKEKEKESTRDQTLLEIAADLIEIGF